MQTIQIDLQDDIYKELLSSGINIQSEIKEFLSSLTHDKYPSITTKEATKRVNQAVERYKNGTGTYLNQDEYKEKISEHLNSLNMKYADN